jgi:hypothetical protein
MGFSTAVLSSAGFSMIGFSTIVLAAAVLAATGAFAGGTATGVTDAAAAAAAAAVALADFRGAGFLVETLGIKINWFDDSTSAGRQSLHRENLPGLDGLRQEKFKLNLLTDWIVS